MRLGARQKRGWSSQAGTWVTQSSTPGSTASHWVVRIAFKDTKVFAQ